MPLRRDSQLKDDVETDWRQSRLNRYFGGSISTEEGDRSGLKRPEGKSREQSVETRIETRMGDTEPTIAPWSDAANDDKTVDLAAELGKDTASKGSFQEDYAAAAAAAEIVPCNRFDC